MSHLAKIAQYSLGCPNVMRLIQIPCSVLGSRASRCCLSMTVWSSRERRGLVLLTWDIHILHSLVTDVVVSWYLFRRFRIIMPKRKARKSRYSPDDARRKAARVELERYERTTRERMAISRSRDTETRRYFRLRDDAVKRAGPTLWFSHCAQWATGYELLLQNGMHPVALNLWIWNSRLHVDLSYDSPVKRASPASKQ